MKFETKVRNLSSSLLRLRGRRGGGGLDPPRGVKILIDLVATYFKNLDYREVGAFYQIEKAYQVPWPTLDQIIVQSSAKIFGHIPDNANICPK